VPGVVILTIVIAADGTVSNLKVQKGLGKGLTESAVNAVQTWEFKPATKAGKPVACRVRAKISFKLN
jgi:protein TonB